MFPSPDHRIEFSSTSLLSINKYLALTFCSPLHPSSMDTTLCCCWCSQQPHMRLRRLPSACGWSCGWVVITRLNSERVGSVFSCHWFKIASSSVPLSTRLLAMTVLARLVTLKTNIALSLRYKLHQVYYKLLYGYRFRS